MDILSETPTNTQILKIVGSISLAILYGVNTIACLIVPRFINHWISLKMSIFLGGITYCLFVAAYINLQDNIFFSVSAVEGIGAAFLWIANGSFITECSNQFEYVYINYH